ncbi:ABC transporter permease [candidate division KSB1 bacterium]|nr:ABC transporter permease [candidate division KSB1 bacterium]
MNLKESTWVALDALRANKMRSALTTLGIVIGVATIIGMMSIIQGLQNFMVAELSVLGSGTFQIQKDPPVQFGHLDEKYERRKILKFEHAQAIKEQATLVKAVGPQTYLWGQTIKHRDKKTNPEILVFGATPEFQVVYSYFVDEGRFISDTDVEFNRNVIILGLDVVETLFPHSNPVGEEVRIGTNRFRVVGTLERQGSSFGQSRDNRVVLPITTFHKMYGDKRSISITVQVTDARLVNEAVEQVSAILRIARKIPPGEPNDFEIFTSESLIKTFNDLSFYVKVAAIGIALISLLVGGIGIMNIMLVSVTERTREIGIRKSIGARRRDILWQFMTEAVILGNLGGILGIIIGSLIGIFIRSVTPLPTAIPLWTLFLGIGFCSLVGLFFGIYPAARAARLDPIVALRYE